MIRPNPDLPTLTKAILPSFWLRWLGAFLVLLPALFWLELLFPPLHFSLVGSLEKAAAASLTAAVLPLVAQALGASDGDGSRQAAHTCELALRLTLHQRLGIVCAVVGVASWASHAIIGQLSALQVIEFTLAAPAYLYVVALLMELLAGFFGLREARKRGNVARPTILPEVPVVGAELALQPVAVDVNDTRTVQAGVMR